MNHKELVRIIYNEFMSTAGFHTVSALSVEKAASSAARAISNAASVENGNPYENTYLRITEGYQPRGTRGEYPPNPPGTPRRVATSASMSHDSHGRPTYTAVDHAGNIWTKLADGVWNKQPPLPQD